VALSLWVDLEMVMCSVCEVGSYFVFVLIVENWRSPAIQATRIKPDRCNADYSFLAI